MSSDAAETGGVIAAATTVVAALWLALRAATSESRADLKTRAEKAEGRAEQAETRALYWERKSWELAAEIKAAAARRHSLPPGRDEMPTLDAILDLRSGDVVAARQRALDDDLQRFVAGNPSAPPLAGVAPSTPNRGKPPR